MDLFKQMLLCTEALCLVKLLQAEQHTGEALPTHGERPVGYWVESFAAGTTSTDTTGMDHFPLLILLLQTTLTVANPDYGIANTVAGTARVLSSTSDASSYLDTLASSKLVPATITQSAYSLPSFVELLQKTGTTVSQDGIKIAHAISALAQSTSDDPATLFDTATESIQEALDHITQLLPSTKSSLTALIGNNIPERLTDSFARIEDRLKTLKLQLGTLKSAILAAVAEAGSTSPIPAEILRQHITLQKVYDVVDSTRKLRAFLPVVRFTLNTSIEDAVEADSYLKAYSGMLATLDSMVTVVVQPLDQAKELYYAALKGGVRALAASYKEVKDPALELAVNQVAGLGTLIENMFVKLTTPIADVDRDAAAVSLQLQSYLNVIKTMVGMSSDPVVNSVTESKLIGALIHTLIDSGPYSRFCFHKYKDQVTDLVNYLLEESALCIDREIPRLGNLAPAVQSVLDVNTFDFEDILDWLTICDELLEPANQSDCVTRITQTYTTVGDYFADKYTLIYDLTTTELNASKQRIKICNDLSRRWLADGYIPHLQTEIEQCAINGPNI